MEELDNQYNVNDPESPRPIPTKPLTIYKRQAIKLIKVKNVIININLIKVINHRPLPRSGGLRSAGLPYKGLLPGL